MIFAPALALAALSISAHSPTSYDLDRAIVPADTPFLVHLDLRAFKNTSLAEAVLSGMSDELDLDGMEFDEVEAEFGVHPLKDFHTVTVFSVTGGAEGGVAVVRTSARIDALVTRLSGEEGYHTVERGGLTLHAMEDEFFAYVQAVDAERLVVISDDPEQVVGAVQVMRGKRKSLARAKNPALRARPMPDAFLFAEVGPILSDILDDSPASQVGRLAKGVTLHIGERKDQTFVRAEVQSSDDRSAGEVASVLSGALSLARLAGRDELPSFALDLIDGIDVTRDGDTVRIDLSVDSQTLVEELDDLSDEF